MGSHPINLAFRFVFELLALASVGVWGWRMGESWLKYLFAIGIPLVLAVIWGVFNVPDDPSRSGAAPVVVHGLIRLMIELAIFSFSVWTLFDMGYTKVSLLFGVLVLIHYIISYDRIQFILLK